MWSLSFIALIELGKSAGTEMLNKCLLNGIESAIRLVTLSKGLIGEGQTPNPTQAGSFWIQKGTLPACSRSFYSDVASCHKGSGTHTCKVRGWVWGLASLFLESLRQHRGTSRSRIMGVIGRSSSGKRLIQMCICGRFQQLHRKKISQSDFISRTL